MTQLRQIYVCQKCGNVVEVVRASAGTLACCNQPMTLAEENTTDAAQEKHVPVVEKADGKLKVTVGSVDHPMQDDHYIEWIELLCEDHCCRMHLKPGAEPSATFACGCEPAPARAYCNLHGLWKG